nr:MAG TPA: hypothetical protein [Bacteriophage sp.]DAR11133.1 MAG TPA: hypothetical protein [Bacteriophage sp.]
MENEEYKQKIIELINKTDDLWILNQIYRFICNMIKERG